jgi:ribosomal protein L14E/L6E/L27E
LLKLAQRILNLKPKHPIKMEKFEALKSLIASLEGDADKFYNKANSAAGTRIRKGMQDLKNAAQAIRQEVQELKNKEQ